MNSSIYGEKMQAKVENSTLGVRYTNQYEPQPKTTLRDLGPEQDVTRPCSATELLDDLFKSIELLEMETSGLFAQIDCVLTELNETQCQPRPGPRFSNSNLTYRIAHAADLIDELTNRVNLIRRRITL